MYFEDVMLKVKNNRVLTQRIEGGRHFGVYEGDGIMSDLTYSGDVPAIRFQEMKSYNTPNRVLRYSKETFKK